MVFVPFRFGYFDAPGTDGRSPGKHPRAANELTLTEWDPVSKQPLLKVAAVQVVRVGPGHGPAPAPTTTASAPADPAAAPATVGGPEAETSEGVDVAPPPHPAPEPESDNHQPGSGGHAASDPTAGS